MSSNPFDKTARFVAKQDPIGFHRWLLRNPVDLTFREWLDTRTIPYPGEADRICDTVGRLDRKENATPVACITEFQSHRDPTILEREAEYALRVRRELRHGPRRGRRFDVIGAVVNLPPAGVEARRKLVAEAAALVCPTQYVEPLGNVALEAQISGTPVIATDWGGFMATAD